MRKLRRCGIAALVLTGACRLAPGQPVLFDGPVFQPGGVAEVEPDELSGSVTLRESAALGRRLKQVDRILAEGDFAEAAELLGRLAESIEEDVFVRTGEERQSLRSFRGAVQRRIGGLPPEGRAAYEVAFGRAARRMLEDGATDRTLLERVATVYLHTDAGADALYRVALLRRDRGSYADAAACLERLAGLRPEAVSRFEPKLWVHLAACRVASGDRAGAEAALSRLSGTGAFHTGPRLYESAGELLAGLSQELPARAVVAGGIESASQAGRPFLVPRWTEEAFPLRDGAIEASKWPNGFPSVVGPLVLVPTPAGFRAHDARTGTRLWSYPSDEAASDFSETPTVGSGLRRLSTDGRAVFVVERESGRDVQGTQRASTDDGGLVQRQVAFFGAPFAMPGTPAASVAAPANSLTALDVRPPKQGNRLWRVGGSHGFDEPRLAGHSFLGPPLAAESRLYVLAEFAGTTRLVVLDAESGRLDWSIDLADAETPLATDLQRQRIEVTPVLAGSLLFCATGGGAVVAVDAASRSLVWGFRYSRSAEGPGTTPDAALRTGGLAREWLSGTVHLSDGFVLLTPPESSHLYCLDRENGQLSWQRSRDEHFFLAGVDAAGGRALLVGPASATLLALRDGSTMSSLSFGDGARPSGLGYWSGGSYVQPLSNGSLYEIDPVSGTGEVIARSTRGVIPGNLHWHDGALISVGSDFIRVFDDLERLEREIASRLAADPQDAGALLRRADLHAAEGRSLEAIEDTRRAYALEPSPAAKVRLVASLLDGIRGGLQGAEQLEEELERLAH